MNTYWILWVFCDGSNPTQSLLCCPIVDGVFPYHLSLSHLQVLWWWMKGAWVPTSSKKMPRWSCRGALVLLGPSEARKKWDLGYEHMDSHGFLHDFAFAKKKQLHDVTHDHWIVNDFRYQWTLEFSHEPVNISLLIGQYRGLYWGGVLQIMISNN